jgi:hypothetical protein
MLYFISLNNGAASRRKKLAANWKADVGSDAGACGHFLMCRLLFTEENSTTYGGTEKLTSRVAAKSP